MEQNKNIIRGRWLMKKSRGILFFVFAAALCFIFGSCAQTEEEVMKETCFYIKANGTTFAADFADNSSADALCDLLREGDLTVDMHDYGNFEKVGEIGHALPQNNTQITTEPGDVILYLGTNITIYYDSNSWNFTRVGKIQNVTKDDLLAVFGDGNVTVTFSLAE